MKIRLKPIIVIAIVLVWAAILSIAVVNKLQADNGASQPGQLYVFEKPVPFLSTKLYSPAIHEVGQKLHPYNFYSYQAVGLGGIPDDAKAVTGVVKWADIPSGNLILFPAGGSVDGSYSTLGGDISRASFTVLLGDGGKLGVWLTGHSGDIEILVTGYYR